MNVGQCFGAVFQVKLLTILSFVRQSIYFLFKDYIRSNSFGISIYFVMVFDQIFLVCQAKVFL